MKILLIMAGFFPGKKYGGPPVSADNFCSLMKNDDCFIVTSNHDMNEIEPYDGIAEKTWIKRSNCKVMYLSDVDYNKKTFRSVILEVQPDVLYLQGLFQRCILPCLELSKELNLKVLLAPRGELCKGAFIKKYKKIPYIQYCRIKRLFKNVSFQSTSEEETECIKKYLRASDNRIIFLTNVPSIPVKDYGVKEKNYGEARLIFLSRIHPKKNLISAIQYLKNINGNVVFDIYGPIEDLEYWNECEKMIERLPHNICVNYCGLVSHDEVHKIFSNYDAFLFPTFSENYGHVIAEALVVGTMVIISNQTPWNDVNEYGVGYALSLDNVAGFETAIQNVVDSNGIDNRLRVLNYINQRLQINELYCNYLNAFSELIKEN